MQKTPRTVIYCLICINTHWPAPVFQTIHTVARVKFYFFIYSAKSFSSTLLIKLRASHVEEESSPKRGYDCTLRLIQNKSKKRNLTIPILMKLINNFALSVYFTGRPTSQKQVQNISAFFIEINGFYRLIYPTFGHLPAISLWVGST